ncbi:hypothetical protein K440DRAFT_593923 [Wilcoxina mikolae CBS 423.85]|nr:hypothetical protein K440DRAFT_593923 [Wilcoxina mikolae CBS 423.85]
MSATHSAQHPDFANLPWCRELLSSPTTTVVETTARITKSNTEDSLFGTTFHTPDTIRAYLILRTPTETLTLVSLGNGVNGHANVAHGGVVVTILDETLGAAVGYPSFTAYLNTSFKKPVVTPGVLLCRASVTRSERRKYWVSGTLEDGCGTVFAEAEGLFIGVKEGPKL